MASEITVYSATITFPYKSVSGSVSKPVKILFATKEEARADAERRSLLFIEKMKGSLYEFDEAGVKITVDDFWVSSAVLQLASTSQENE